MKKRDLHQLIFGAKKVKFRAINELR